MARKKKETLPEIVPQFFEHEEFGEIRFIQKDGEVWFVANDVCRVLGYANPRKALADHVDDDEKGVTKCYTLGGVQTLAIINESGLYSLIFGSTMPAAKKFKRWVTHEVLPSIRKYGFYSVKPPEEEKIYVEITGNENFKLFKKKFPEIDFEKALRRLGFTKIYDEHGYYQEEDVYTLRFDPDDYEKISRAPLSISCIEKLPTSKNHRISQTTPQNKKLTHKGLSFTSSK